MIPKYKGYTDYSEPQQDKRHVIMLRRTVDKNICRMKQALQQLLGVEVRVRFHLGDQSVFPPLVF